MSCAPDDFCDPYCEHLDDGRMRDRCGWCRKAGPWIQVSIPPPPAGRPNRLVAFAIIIAAFIAGLVVARHALAQDFDSWLVLVVDTSGSVTDPEYRMQKDGYVEVLLDPMIAHALDRTAVAIIEFGSTAAVVVSWTDVRGAGAAYRAHEREFAGNTCVACGLELAFGLLDGKAGKRVIDVSGDGEDNMRGHMSVQMLRDQATANRIEINTLALVMEDDPAPMFGGTSRTGGGPYQNASLERWYAEMANGFSMSIRALEDLAYALRQKLFAEVAAVTR